MKMMQCVIQADDVCALRVLELAVDFFLGDVFFVWSRDFMTVGEEKVCEKYAGLQMPSKP